MTVNREVAVGTEKPTVSRRGFLKGAASAGLVAAAGAAFAGCTPATSSNNGEKEAARKSDAELAFEAERAPIDPVDPPASWDKEADVVVVGSGAGGMTGALRLALEGRKVIMLEKDQKTGGASRYSGFFVNFGGHRMAEELKWAWPSYPYDPDKIVQYLNDMWGQTADPALLRSMAIEGPLCIDWMSDELGVPWAPLIPNLPAGAQALYWDGQITAKNSIMINDHTFNYLTDLAKEKGVEVITGTPVQALVLKDGSVIGVKASDSNGNDIFIRGTEGVLLTSGGFEMNRAMLQKYLPTCFDGLANVPCPPCNTGECIRMGIGAGADLSGFDSTGSYDGGVWWGEYGEYDTRMTAHINKDGNQAVRQPWLRINQMGERVPYLGTTYVSYPYAPSGNEMVNGLTDQSAVEIMQPGGKTYVCFDSKYEDLVSQNYFKQGVCRVGKIIPEDDPLIERVPEWQRDWRTGFGKMVESGAVKKCDTIEELEEALGLRKGLLVDAAKKWNEACREGKDYVDDYAYDPSWLIPLDTPPYYGAKLGGNIFTTKCGLRINQNMQVIDTQGAVIPGLFAGWHTAGGANGEVNIGGRPFGGMYGDVGQSFVGGYMAAGAIIDNAK